MSLPVPEGYRALDAEGVVAHVAGLPALAARLGGAPAEWRVREVGDGNLNLVFFVEGPDGDLCLKQALPYVRMVGESWPLPLARALFEHRALVHQARRAPAFVPAVLHHDPVLHLTVMERLHPHLTLRNALIEGETFSHFADHIAEFLACTLFFVSDLAMDPAAKKAEVAYFCANTDLCAITEDLIFTDPYMEHERNRWTSPQLDADAAAIRADAELKAAVAWLKHRFMTSAETLLHGDLHTGSIMVTATDTRVIDAEFAFFGPIGFDVGKLIGNLLISHLSQDGHEHRAGERDPQRAWLLSTIERIWTGFERRFLELWAEHARGASFPAPLFADAAGRAALDHAKAAFMRRIFEDALGFAGCAMIRRTLGLAHVGDFERIADANLRAACERRNLRLARHLIVNAGTIADSTALSALARRARELP